MNDSEDTKMIQVTCRLTQQEANQLAIIAANDRRSLSSLVAVVLEKFLQTQPIGE